MFKKNYILGFMVLVLSLALAACGVSAPAAPAPARSKAVQSTKPAVSAAETQPTQPSASGNLSPTLPAVANGENNGETAGVEAALVTYSDAAQGFAIGHPGPWTQDTSVTSGVKFVGGDSSLTLEFATPPAGMDAMTYAKNDVTAVTTAFPGFKQLNLNASTEVQKAIVLGFNANGRSVVTGKVFTAHDERYYMPLADGRIAILTVVSSENHYDREGVRDIALTFKTTK